MTYEMKCTKCNKEIELNMLLKDYEDGKPHKCKCGGDLDRHFRSLHGCKTETSPNRY